MFSTIRPVIELPAREKPPVGTAVVLHGWGANKHDLLPFAETLGVRALRYLFPEGLVEVPGTDGLGKAWFTFPVKQESEIERQRSREQVMGILDELDRTGTPTRKVVLMGFSQGASMSFDVALNYRRQVGAVIAMSGFLMDGDEIRRREELPTTIPIFAAHGTFDPLVPLEKARESIMILRDRGFDLEWHEYPMNHRIVIDEIQDINQFLIRLFRAPS